MGATSDSDRSLRDFEVFGEKLDERGVGLAVMSAGMKIHRKSAVGIFDELFLRAAGLDSNRIRRHTYIIHRDIIRVYAKI